MTSSRTTKGRGKLYDNILETIGDTPLRALSINSRQRVSGSM